jgi:hypothetical protein
MMATTRQPERVRTVSPHHRFKKLGSEEVHTIESYERTIHGTPYSDPKREFSTNQYTERRTYGRDENGEIVVKIEKDPKEPVRPVSPVRPISPAGEHSYDSTNNQLLKPLPHVDILPLHIPRPKSTPSPRSLGSFNNDQNSPKSAQSFGHSPRSGRSSGFGSAGTPPGRGVSPAGSNVSGNAGIPMKKVIRKTRLVSIHDGRPVSPYVETVTYEPAIKLPPSRTTIIRDSNSGEDYTSDENDRRHQQRHGNRNRGSFGSRKLHYSEEMETIPFRRRSSLNHENFYERENNNNEGFYGTPGSSYRRQTRSNNVRSNNDDDYSRSNHHRHHQNRNHSDSDSRPHRRRSHSPANNSSSNNTRRKSRDEGAYIMENPLYMAY